MPTSYLDSNGLKHYTDKLKQELQSQSVVTSFNGRTGAITPQSGDYTAAMVSAVPTSRTVNGKALSGNISLNAKDIDIVTRANSVCILGSARGNDVAIGTNSVADIGPYAGQGGSVAIGFEANAYAFDAIAIGHNACSSNSECISIGCNVFSKGMGAISIGLNINESSSYGAIAIGSPAHVNGHHPMAIGSSAAANNDFATALGANAAANGMNTVAIGSFSSVSSTAIGSSALGHYAICTESDTIQLGNASYLSKLSCKVALSVTSDERDKTDITPIGDGAVEFLNRIKAIRYVFNGRELYIPEDEKLSDVDRANKSKYGMCSYDKEAHALGTKKGERVRVGVLAQEVQKALQEIYGDKSYANLVDDNFFDLDPSTIPEGVENKLTMTYENFIPFLIKAVQELDQRVKELESKEV